MARLVLASGSPRRARILETLGVDFRVVVPGIDETMAADETALAGVERLAREKAEQIARGEALPVLAADTMVVCDRRILGKPASSADAASMLRQLAGRSHEVVTGVCLVSAGRSLSSVERTVVSFAPMDDAEIEWYVASREPMDKAGGYHIDGRGALFVTAVEGSPSNVAGLPVRVVLRLARELGVDLGLP